MNFPFYRITLGACLVSVLLSTSYFAWNLPTASSVLMLSAAQCGVYGVIAAYARTCRTYAAASTLVFSMAVAAMLVTGTIAYLIAPPIGYGVVIWIMLLLLLQAVIAILGCYFGYAMVECRRLRHYRRHGPTTTQ